MSTRAHSGGLVWRLPAAPGQSSCGAIHGDRWKAQPGEAFTVGLLSTMQARTAKTEQTLSS